MIPVAADKAAVAAADTAVVEDEKQAAKRSEGKQVALTQLKQGKLAMQQEDFEAAKKAFETGLSAARAIDRPDLVGMLETQLEAADAKLEATNEEMTEYADDIAAVEMAAAALALEKQVASESGSGSRQGSSSLAAAQRQAAHAGAVDDNDNDSGSEDEEDESDEEEEEYTTLELAHIRQKFDEIDADGSGTLEGSEIRDLVTWAYVQAHAGSAAGLTDEARTAVVDQMMENLDGDGDGKLDFEEVKNVLAKYLAV